MFFPLYRELYLTVAEARVSLLDLIYRNHEEPIAISRQICHFIAVFEFRDKLNLFWAGSRAGKHQKFQELYRIQPPPKEWNLRVLHYSMLLITKPLTVLPPTKMAGSRFQKSRPDRTALLISFIGFRDRALDLKS